jgi:hypothetical protein
LVTGVQSPQFPRFAASTARRAFLDILSFGQNDLFTADYLLWQHKPTLAHEIVGKKKIAKMFAAKDA